MHDRSSLVESSVWLLPFLCVPRKREEKEKMKEKMKEKREKRKEEKKRERDM